MLNHTYTSVKNANLVDCGKKQHIPSQPAPLLKDNFLGEFRTELDKKKVLANLGVATDLSLEWEYIKGDIGRSESLMQELDSRTKYISELDNFEKTVVQGIKYLESVIGKEEETEEQQNTRLTTLETESQELTQSITELKTYIENSIDVSIETINKSLEDITQKVNNITNLIQVSVKADNALQLISTEEELGLYVPDLSKELTTASENITTLQNQVEYINTSLDNYVTKEDLGGSGDFDFVNQSEFDSYKSTTNNTLSTIQSDLSKTVKTGEDGHVDTLYVNKISKDNNNGNILITDSFEVTSNIPLDVRLLRNTLEELYALPPQICYPGMGVIVSSQSSLYILRKPQDGVVIDQDYVSNPYNWKCPEDLVTVALGKQEYESLEEINPNVFYYVYEEEISTTKEPKREDFDSEELFKVEWQKWVDSLKTLSQEYMSASWGIELDNKLSEKANQRDVTILMQEVGKIKGGGDGLSLEYLNSNITNLSETQNSQQQLLNEILNKESDSGRLIEAENKIQQLEVGLDNYVTKDYIQDASNDFIFITKDQYSADTENLKNDLGEEITTKVLNAQTINTNEININDLKLEQVDDRISINSKSVAHVEDLPNIQVLTQLEYENLDVKDEKAYYYTYDSEDSLVTQSELQTSLQGIQQSIDLLNQTVVTKSELESLKARIEALEQAIQSSQNL